MSLIKGIKVGSTDITGTYVTETTFTDTEHLDVVAVNLNQVGNIQPIGDMVYSGTAQEPLPTVTAIVGDEIVELIRNTDYTVAYENNTSAGVATVIVTGINNYTGSISENWNITESEIIVDVTDQSYVYNGNPQGSGVSVSITDGEATVMYGWEEGNYNLSECPRITNVSDSGTVYFMVTAPNHNPYTGSYELAVTPLLAELTWGDLTWVYDGDEHQTTCIVNNLISGDVCNVVLSGNSIDRIGHTTVVVTGLSNSNYELGSSNISRTISITPGLYINVSGNWIPVKKVFRKVSGMWVQQEVGSSFNEGERYVGKI